MAYQEPILARFFSKLDINQETGCWLWMGEATDRYGTLYLGGKKLLGKRTSIGAHRFSYEYFVSDIPDGLQIDHLCRVRSCVNPNHLDAVTPGENLLRGETVNAVNKKRVKCKNGHEFTTSPSPYYSVRGWRKCNECHRISEATRRNKLCIN